MKIRATQKVLSIARIEAIKDPDPLIDKMPGEWYASIVSRGLPGKLAIHFLHYPTLASLIIPEKSLNKAVKEMSEQSNSPMWLTPLGLQIFIFGGLNESAKFEINASIK